MRFPGDGTLLIAGAGGFIGRALAERAVSRGITVTGLVRRADPAGGPAGAELLEADLTDRASLDAALGGRCFDYVINLAGHIDHSGFFSGGRAIITQHFTGLMNLLEATRHDALRGFVQVGSSDEYGDAAAPQHESMREAPISPYAAAKTAAGHLVSMLWRNEGFPGKVARLFLVYGAGQSASRFIPQLVRGALGEERFAVSAGAQQRDFCYVDDIADGLLALLHCESANGLCVNLGSGTPVTVREVIERVVAMTGTGTPDWGRVPYRAGENMALVADIARARALFGWEPATTLDDGLARTVDWYRRAFAS